MQPLTQNTSCPPQAKDCSKLHSCYYTSFKLELCFCAVVARICRLRRSLQYVLVMLQGTTYSLRKAPQFSAKLPQTSRRQISKVLARKIPYSFTFSWTHMQNTTRTTTACYVCPPLGRPPLRYLRHLLEAEVLVHEVLLEV